MRIAVFADVHGNAPALEAVLRDLDAEAPDRIVVAGDVPFGPRPAEVLGAVLDRGYPMIMGNTDLWITQAAGVWGGQDSPPAGVVDVAAWCASRMPRAHLDAVARLPALWRDEPEGGSPLVVVHATPGDLLEAVFPDDPEERFAAMLRDAGDPGVLAYAHIHRIFQRRVGGRLVVNTGAVGAPYDGDPRASYAIFTWDGDWRVEHRRVAYDVDAAVADLHAVGFPWAEEWERRYRAARP